MPEAHALTTRLWERQSEVKHLRFPDPAEEVLTHNLFMRSVFPELLEKITLYFKLLLGTECFYTDEIGYPGFHIFEIAPKSLRPIWFHSDDSRAILEKEFPQFQVSRNSRQISFTVLLDLEPGLTAGLLYFSDQKLAQRVMKSGVNDQQDLEKFATRHLYKVGEMNYFENITHAVYARNDSDHPVHRISLSGHLIETHRGFLTYR